MPVPVLWLWLSLRRIRNNRGELVKIALIICCAGKCSQGVESSTYTILYLIGKFKKFFIEKLKKLRYNYCVKLFIQSDPESIPAGEMR